MRVLNKDVNLGENGHSLFSRGGTVLMIHAKADDMNTDAGNFSVDHIASEWSRNKLNLTV